MNGAAEVLEAILASRRPGIAETLLTESTARGSTTFDQIRFEEAFAIAGRRLGTDPLGPSGATVGDGTGRTWAIASWGFDEVARALLLLSSLPHVPQPERAAWVADCYRVGTLRERQAVLRTLALLPEPATFLSIALDACRASTQPIFEAIACDNPYPAAYFPEANFNQLVLKAVYTEVPLVRILDLATRRTPELARMASAYASERNAAGRLVPRDLEMLTSP